MKVGVLTSSRADFGIYLPLLKRMKEDPFFELEIIAFGTHLSHFHGYTLDHITNEGLAIPYKIESLILGDTIEAMSTSMALTSMKFASFWQTFSNRFDIVFCMGDRYEMHAAVIAAVPFGIRFAHFHGGETTLGAVDNFFRHSISLCSQLHFVATETYYKRVTSLLCETDGVYVTGALSLDNLSSILLYSKEEFYDKWQIDLDKPTVLVTLHSETVGANMNQAYAETIASVINQLDSYQVVITMPNSDAGGLAIRRVWDHHLEASGRIIKVENFGTKGYFSAMKYCSFMLGNTSSGIIEAASFNKYVINLGDRQKGRARSENVFDCHFEPSQIVEAVKVIEKLPPYQGPNVYWQGGAVEKIIQVLKEHR